MKLTREHLTGLFPLPQAHDSKYTRGVVGLITGTEEYPGAGVLSASAAASCGAGYVRYNGPSLAVRALIAQHPEVVFSATAQNHVDAWVLGSGFAGIYADTDDESRHDNDEMRSIELRRALDYADKNDSFIVVDAGALEFFATAPLSDSIRRRCIITPHAGEAQRMCEVLGHPISRADIEEGVHDNAGNDNVKATNRLHVAQWLAQTLGCTVVLKGSRTLIAQYDSENSSYITLECPQAIHWLATAGTGDILAGIMGAMCALNASALRDGRTSLAQAAAAAVCVHSYAAGVSSEDTHVMEEWLHESAEESATHGSADNSPALTSHQINHLDMIASIPHAMVRLREASSAHDLLHRPEHSDSSPAFSNTHVSIHSTSSEDHC